jgi:hypothetical protein
MRSRSIAPAVLTNAQPGEGEGQRLEVQDTALDTDMRSVI